VANPNWQHTKTYDIPTWTISDVVDGMMHFLSVNLVAHTPLARDAHAGDTVIYVDDNLRFEKFDGIAVMDDNSSQDPNTHLYSGVEFHKINQLKVDSTRIFLKEPLEKDFLVSDHGRIQKALENTVLFEKDILYGDRGVIAFDYIAVCVEPEGDATEWMALGGLLSNEYTLSVIVYVKTGGLGEEEAYAQRICNVYGDSIKQLLLNGIHLDLCVDEVKLRADGCPGADFVVIGKHAAKDWPPDDCRNYDVQDNFNLEVLHSIRDPSAVSSSSSETTCPSCWVSSSTESVSSSSSTMKSSQSLSSSSRSSKSSSSFSSVSRSLSTDSSSLSSFPNSSSSSSTTSGGGGNYRVYLDSPLRNHYRVSDHAKLRRIKRFFYDSRASNVEYGTVQKGSVFLKAGVIRWFGKETNVFRLPQIGRGAPVEPKGK
jgi:hypothetical protein